jgi:putative transposase
MKTVFIQPHQERFKVNLLCQTLEVSRSGDYAWCQRPESRRAGEPESRRAGDSKRIVIWERRSRQAPRGAARPMAPGVFARNESKKVSPSAVRGWLV